MQPTNIHFKVILNYLWIPELLFNVCHIQKSFKAEKKVYLAGTESLLCFFFHSWCYENPDFISGCWICFLDGYFFPYIFKWFFWWDDIPLTQFLHQMSTFLLIAHLLFPSNTKYIHLCIFFFFLSCHHVPF